MWVRFTDVFKWSPPEAKKAWSKTYQPSTQNVPRSCGDAAIAAGKAEVTDRPGKASE